MNVLAYIVYLLITYVITFKVGLIFYRNGKLYILGLMRGDEHITNSINRLLLIGNPALPRLNETPRSDVAARGYFLSMSLNISNELLALEMKILLARKVAQRYENQNATDDPHYAEVLRLIGDLEQRRQEIAGICEAG